MSYVLLKRPAKNTHSSAASGRKAHARIIVGSPNDPLERHADLVAARVIYGMERAPSDVESRDQVSRPAVAEPSGADEVLRRKCSQCENDEERPVLRRATSAGGTAFTADTTLATRLQRERARGGRALEPSLRARLERGVGSDLSAVRIHDDSRAIALTQQVSARAFTLGNDIFFNRGEYHPRTRDGAFLVAHEVAHTTQKGSTAAIRRKLDVAESDPRAEPDPQEKAGTECPKVTLDHYNTALGLAEQELQTTIGILNNIKGQYDKRRTNDEEPQPLRKDTQFAIAVRNAFGDEITEVEGKLLDTSIAHITSSYEAIYEALRRIKPRCIDADDPAAGGNCSNSAGYSAEGWETFFIWVRLFLYGSFDYNFGRLAA